MNLRLSVYSSFRTRPDWEMLFLGGEGKQNVISGQLEGLARFFFLVDCYRAFSRLSPTKGHCRKIC